MKGKKCNEFKLLSNKQSLEEVSNQRALKTTLQILHDKGLIDNYNNADEVIKIFLFTTQSFDLEEIQ